MEEELLREILSNLEESEQCHQEAVEGEMREGGLEAVTAARFKAHNIIRALILRLRDKLDVATPEGECKEASFRVSEVTKLGKRTLEQHESYGKIAVTRVTDDSIRLVGSMLKSLPTYRRLTVHRADRVIDQDSHTETYSSRGPALIDVCLNSYQWAEMISSSHGIGVPCTLKRVMGVQMDPVPEDVKTSLEESLDDMKSQLRSQLSKREKVYLETLKELLLRVSVLSIRKGKRQSIETLLKRLEGYSTLPTEKVEWATKRITEDSHRAKMEITAALTAALTGLTQQKEAGE